jgi:hypothetical protein
MIAMAEIIGDDEMRDRAIEDLEKAKRSLERKFWISDLEFYSYGITEDGEQVREKTPWSSVAIMFELTDRERAGRTLEMLNSSEISTDWGTRTLAPSSSLFEPSNYNYGAVWPFISAFLGTAQYRHHHALSGYMTLRAVVNHVFEYGLGFVPEVFSGEINQKLEEAYHHQGFSTTGYILPVARGLLGLNVNAIKREVIFAPHLPPDWDKLAIRNIKVGKNTIHFDFKKSNGRIELSVRKFGPDSIYIKFSPALSPGSKIIAVKLNGKVTSPDVFTSEMDVHPEINFELLNDAVVEIIWKPSVEIIPPTIQTDLGATNRSIKFISCKFDDGSLYLILEGIGGETYKIKLLNYERIKSVDGGKLEGNILSVSFPDVGGGKFIRKSVIILLK